MAERYIYHSISSDEKASVLNRVRDVLLEEGVSLAIVFGSFVDLDSFRDVDIAVYVRGGASLDRIIELMNRLEEALGIPVDIVPLDEVDPKFRLNIFRKGIEVVEEPGIYEALFMQSIDELAILSKDQDLWDQ